MRSTAVMIRFHKIEDDLYYAYKAEIDGAAKINS